MNVATINPFQTGNLQRNPDIHFIYFLGQIQLIKLDLSQKMDKMNVSLELAHICN